MMTPTTTPMMNRITRVLLAILALSGLLTAPISGATYTLAPLAYQTVLDVNGNPVSNAKICTYAAGTTTPVTTFADSSGTPNANPLRASSEGRFVMYLAPGASYKLVFQDATGTANTCDGASIKTVDNVAAVPASAANLDITGTAGEALTAGQAVYLSDGSGSKSAGQWYKADNTLAYSSSLPQIGMVPASIASGQGGTIRLSGQMTGLTTTTGTTYYIGTAGAITATSPAQRRALGVADSTSTLILTPNPSVAVQTWVNDFRLTLTTAVPVTITDVTAATTIYASPLTGNRIDLPDAAGNPSRLACSEFSIAVPATTSQMYDAFAYNSAGTCALELLAWTNDTTRATAIIRTTTGRLYKTGDLTRMYVGSVRTTTVSGQTEDSAVKRYLWNYYNQKRRVLQRLETTASWTYSTATWRQANAAAANQVEVVVGVAETPITLTLLGQVQHNASTSAVAIGEDSTTAPTGLVAVNNFVAGGVPAVSSLTKVPAVGRHFYAWLEWANGATGTFYGKGGVGPTEQQSGLSGFIEG